MTEQELDQTYTAICRALGDVGPQQAERFLAMLCMALVVRCEKADELLPLIDSLRHRCGDAPATPAASKS